MHENFLSIFKKQQKKKAKKKSASSSYLNYRVLHSLFTLLSQKSSLQNSVFSPFAHHKKRCGLRQLCIPRRGKEFY